MPKLPSSKWILFSGGLLLVCLVQLAVSQAPTLKVDVNLVSIFCTVQNGAGGFVSGLRAEDFRVFDDDVEQKIDVFEKEDSVDSAIGVLFDNSLSVVDILPMMKDGLLDFARRTRSFNDYFVMTFGTRVRVLHEMKEPLSNLESQMKLVRAQGSSVLFDGLVEGMRRVAREEHERKALIVFSDGIDNGSKAGYREVLQEAQQTGALLYFLPIGARVLIDEHTIDALAAETGGRVHYLSKTDPVSPAMEGIRRELSQQYYLGYYTTKRSGLHRIRVEVPDRDVRVRAKTGYRIR